MSLYLQIAGFIDDGVKPFKGGMFGFNTACSYIYWANTRYFGYYLFKEQLKYLRDFQEFVSKNEYSVDMEVLIDAQEFCEKQKLALSRYDKVIEFFSKEENQKIENDFNNLILNRQETLKSLETKILELNKT